MIKVPGAVSAGTVYKGLNLKLAKDFFYNPNGRLFTFGCSITKYYYPTWADIIGKKWKYFENWGQGGCGNSFIFSSIMECDQRHRFTKEDTVLVMWTCHGRHDFYQFGKWIGTVNAWPDQYGNDHFNCPTGYEIMNYSLVQGMYQYLTSKNINFRFFRWPVWDADSDVYKLYQESLSHVTPIDIRLNDKLYDPWADKNLNLKKRIEEFYLRVSGPDWPSLDSIVNNEYVAKSSDIAAELDEFKKCIAVETKNHQRRMRKEEKIDVHPLPLAHLDIAKKVMPEVDYQDQVSWISYIENQILSNQSFDFTPFCPVRF